MSKAIFRSLLRLTLTTFIFGTSSSFAIVNAAQSYKILFGSELTDIGICAILLGSCAFSVCVTYIITERVIDAVYGDNEMAEKQAENMNN